MRASFIPFLIVFFFLCRPLAAKVWINEFMQSNIDLVRDDLQEFPDSWIELYNDSTDDVDIRNWYISDSRDYNKGWMINGTTKISAQSYLLIYCDTEGNGLHASFRLDSGNDGHIYLFDSNKNRVDSVKDIPKQPAPNIARGRITDAGNEWTYFVEATPMKKNEGKTSNRLLPHPVFSQAGGIYRESVKISLSLPDNVPSTVDLSDIHYTLDNSEPTIHSPAYSNELTIAKTAVVKAKLIHPDYLTNRSQVHSYIITSGNWTLPVISVSLDTTYLWDEEFGIYCRGNGKYGQSGNGVDYKANWNNDWRRPMNFEYFPVENSGAVLNQLGELRIAGGWSRANVQKSFIVYANKRFGVKRFEYDLFNEKPKQEIKSFMIRNSGNDFWFTHFRDAAIQLFFGGKVDVDYQAYQPAVFYLNGRYWGIQNLRERSTEDFVLANYATENIDMIENWWGELKAGDKTDWNKLLAEVGKPSGQIDFQWLVDQIDINEYINFMILQIYVSNTDFPEGNNMVMWKPKTAGGKWRFILKDTDQGLGIWGANQPNHNALTLNATGNEDAKKLFKALLTQASFKKEFYSRFAVYMGDILHYRSTSQVIDSIQKLIEPEMNNHILRWRDEMFWRDLNSWKNEVNQMKSWCNSRNTYVYTQLKNYFQLGTVMKMTLETSSNLSGTPVVSINETVLQKPGFDGSYFQKETIRLRFENEEATQYAWEITSVVNGNTTTKTFFQKELSYEIADKCTLLKIKIIDSFTEIQKVDFSQIIVSRIDNRLFIEGLEGNSLISVTDTGGRLVYKMSTNEYSACIPLNQKGIFIVKVNSPTQAVSKKIIL
jgi:hypothetical protein